LSLAISKTTDSVFFHLYGCENEILDKADEQELDNLATTFRNWLKENMELQIQLNKHRMLLIEVNRESGLLTSHKIEGA